MKKLEDQVVLHRANTRAVDASNIQSLEQKLGFALSDEYKEYLSKFGFIIFDAYETYGLGIPDEYYLNVLAAFSDLSRDPNYPKNTVPLLEIGDGQYYLYDNNARKVLVWATPNGGIVRALEDGLEAFLVKHLFPA